jgi:integrase
VLPSLRKYLRHNESGFLLINRKGAPLNSNGITKVLNRIGEQERGKPFGSSILRHSYLSHKYQGVDEEKKKDAALMMHSVATQGDYVKTEG